MNYIALKPCRFNGNNYVAGDTIPGDAVVPSRVQVLKIQGIIANNPELEKRPVSAPASPAKHKIPIIKATGRFEIELAPEQILIALEIIQKVTDEAIKDINSIDCEETLILIDRIDSRKSVRDAAKERAAKL